MTKLKVTAWITLIALGVILLMNACSKEDEGNATSNVSMKDAPGDFQQVNIEVTGVEVHTSTGGWESIAVNDSIYDLLLLADSANAALGTAVIPASVISQVRLLLGSQNTVMVDSVIYPLSLSSQDESGLKLNIHKTLTNGAVYTLMLDFQAEESIVLQGNGTYKLKPVVKAEFVL